MLSRVVDPSYRCLIGGKERRDEGVEEGREGLERREETQGSEVAFR